MPFELPQLPYPYDALEPYIDAMTMEIHHQRHHGTYTNNLNAALQKHPELEGKTIEELLSGLQTIVPEDIRTTVRNNGGGYLNHTIFWTIMAPAGKGGGGEPTGELADAINKQWGSFQAFKEAFSQAAITLFGSGWAWLCVDAEGALTIIQTPNQDNPIMPYYPQGLKPIMGIDVWEHAYYLKYQNRRPEYVQNWWNVVNWQEVARRYAEAKTKK
ncbi:Superoxide dismutase [Mn] [bacterium HR17]|uniref:Superoxide dismutase n=1 Tax=Candidatus Fervidibacter japonicus TaxID=2035412 RepID=A0A2H5XDC2_9BACT|nr:Superoxide dismutase [Mn] [bacterium HR17]